MEILHVIQKSPNVEIQMGHMSVTVCRVIIKMGLIALVRKLLLITDMFVYQ